jgi:hypothetical protein
MTFLGRTPKRDEPHQGRVTLDLRPVVEAVLHKRRRVKAIRLSIALILAVAAIGVGGYYSFNRYKVFRLGRGVRESFVAGRYDAAREQLERWLHEQPRSGEAIITARGTHLRTTGRGKLSRQSI